MTEITLEQRVLLVAGWLRKVERFNQGPDQLNAGDLPPGYTLSPDTFLERQRVLVREARDTLETALEEQRSTCADAAVMTAQRRSKLPELVAAGTLDARKANETARELADTISRLQEEADQYDAWLRLLRGEEEANTPNLPLYQYALAWNRFQESAEARPAADAARTKAASAATDPANTWAAKIRGMQRTDKIALSVAFLLSALILFTGYQYMFSWGRLHVEVGAFQDGHAVLTIINSYGDTVALHAPYDGRGLPTDAVRRFGITVDLLDEKGNHLSPPPLETLWSYKDQPGHLYGPVLLSPVSVGELSLHLYENTLPEGTAAMRITLYRAPHRRYASKVLPLPVTAEQRP